MCMKAAVPRSSAKSQGSLARIVGNKRPIFGASSDERRSLRTPRCVNGRNDNMELKEMMDGLIGSYLVELSEAGFTIRARTVRNVILSLSRMRETAAVSMRSRRLFSSTPTTRRTFPPSRISTFWKMSVRMRGTVSGSLSSASPRNWRSLTPTLLPAPGGNMERLSRWSVKRREPKLRLHRGKGGIDRESHQVQGGQQKPPQT